MLTREAIERFVDQLSVLWTMTNGSSTKWKRAWAAADRGEFLTHEEVGACLEKQLAQKSRQ
jgi:predicted transcriptional regulator